MKERCDEDGLTAIELPAAPRPRLVNGLVAKVCKKLVHPPPRASAFIDPSPRRWVVVHISHESINNLSQHSSIRVDATPTHY